MQEPNLLMIPGPTNVAPDVLKAISQPTMSHVSGSFVNILKETLTDLRRIFKTSGLILPLAGTGTLGAEVALQNIIEPGDRVLAISGGYFGDRLAEVATTLGAKVEMLQVSWGSVVDPRQVERELSSTNYRAVLVVHVDTSTGAANPVEKLGEIIRKNGALYVVDTVCSLGGMDVQTDAWGIDACFTASQKALAVPPGLAIVSFSPRALEARDQRKTQMSTYYGDLKRWVPVMEDPWKYFATHPVNMIYGLHESCKAILSEGLEARFARHAKLTRAFRKAMLALGLRCLCEDNAASNTLSVVYYPDGLRDVEFRKTMLEKYGITIAGGLGPLSQKVFRIGHMGNVNQNEILRTIAAIESSLAGQGYKFESGSGTAIANELLGVTR